MLLKTNTDRVFISTEIFNDIADVVFDAVRRNDFEDIKIPKEMLNEELCGAAAGNHKSLITEFIFNGAKNMSRAAACAAEYGHFDLVETLISEYKITSFDMCLAYAARGGQLKMMELMIKLGANDFECAMEYSAQGGHVKCVDFCISRGANNWYRGLAGAKIGKSKKLIDFFEKEIRKNQRKAGCLFIHDNKLYEPKIHGCQVCSKHSTVFKKYESRDIKSQVMCLDCAHAFDKSHDTTTAEWKSEIRFTFQSASNP